MYQLVFRGECTPGTDQAQARSNAKALFKASVDQVDRMFSGRPVVIRNRLDQEQAEKYQAVLARHGMIAYVQPMAGEAPAGAPEPSRDTDVGKGTSTQAGKAAPAAAGAGAAADSPRAEPTAAGSVKVEPGDRLPVAGERVDEVLAGSGLSLDPVGTPLTERQEVEAPMFQHLDDWTLAPPGSDLGVPRDLPPPMVPDVSHLSLVPESAGTDTDEPQNH